MRTIEWFQLFVSCSYTNAQRWQFSTRWRRWINCLRFTHAEFRWFWFFSPIKGVNVIYLYCWSSAVTYSAFFLLSCNIQIMYYAVHDLIIWLEKVWKSMTARITTFYYGSINKPRDNVRIFEKIFTYPRHTNMFIPTRQ